MFDRKKPEDMEHLKEEARLEFERERERLEKEREALKQERARLEQLRESIEAREEELEDLEDELEDLQDTIEDHEEELEDEFEDAESVKEILDVVSDRIPTLITGIQEAVYSPERSKQMARSVAEFYKTLIESGMPERDASALTISHMHNLQTTVMRRTAHVRYTEPPVPPKPPVPPSR